jgi:trk system potassium uptake protein TrkA
VQADAKNIDALKQIGAQDFQVAVVAVGSSIEASVLITANLVDLKVPQIWAKAVSQSHGKILARVGANHDLPRARGRRRVAHLVSGACSTSSASTTTSFSPRCIRRSSSAASA